MRKSFKIALGTTLSLGLFGAGLFSKDAIVSKAGTSWSTNAENAAYSELLSTGNETKNELVSDIDSDVNSKINTAIQSDVDQQQAELEKLLEEYYQMRLNNLTNTPEYEALEKRIKEIQQSVLTSFKQQIDAEFNKQTTGQ